MVNAWKPAEPDMSKFDNAMRKLRWRMGPRVLLAPQAAAAAREELQQARLSALPDVAASLALVRRREQLAQLRLSISSAYVDSLPDVAETLALVSRVRQAETKPKRRRPVMSRTMSAARKRKADEQRVWVASIRAEHVEGVPSRAELVAAGGADLSKPRRRVGTAGYHDAHR